MRLITLMALLLAVSGLQAQRFLPGSYLSPGFIDPSYRGNLVNNLTLNDSTSTKKWSVSKYSGISTSFTFFNGGNATVVSAPMGLQLNRRLNNNLYAFAGVSLAPAYINFNQSFMSADFNKAGQNNSFFKSSNLGIYSRAELGLQFVNDDRTFSISGSIGIERNSYPMPLYNQNTNSRSNPIIYSNR